MTAFRNLMRSILEIVFPVECFGCGRAGVYCCVHCLATVAGMPKTMRLDGGLDVHCGFAYANPIVRRVIHDFKYRDCRIALPALEALVRRWALMHGHLIPEACVLVPVPSHRLKLMKRGFNPAEEVADLLGAVLDLPVVNELLFRVRDDGSQTESPDREMNVAGAFRARPAQIEVFLVDDVCTTAATMRACITALDTAGAICHGGFAVAWGTLKKGNEKPAGAGKSFRA